MATVVHSLLPRDSSGSDSDVWGLESSGDKQLFALNTVFLVFAAAAVVLRLFSGRHRAPRFGIEDYLTVAALLAYAAQAGTVYVMILRGHIGISNPTPTEESEYARMITAVQFPYGFSMGFVRASIIFFQLRLFGVSRWFRRLSYLSLAIVVAWTLTVNIMALTICTPIKYNWNKTVDGHCGDVTKSYEAIAGSGIVMDVMIFTAPMPIIWRLKMSISRKILVSFLFAIGLFDIVTGVMRLVSTMVGIDSDPVLRITWGILEPSIAIFVACAPHYHGIYNGLANKMDVYGLSIYSRLKTFRKSFAGSDRPVKKVQKTEFEKELESGSDYST